MWRPLSKESVADRWHCAGAGARGFLIATSIAEEQENLMSFGAAYAVYRRRTPFLLGVPEALGG